MRSRVTFETDSPQQARGEVRHKAKRRVDAIKIVHQGGCKHRDPYFFRVPALGIDVQILRLERAVLEAIIDEPHKQGLRATVHTVDEAAAIEALDVGADGLEHGVVHEPVTNDRTIELLLRNHTPSAVSVSSTRLLTSKMEHYERAGIPLLRILEMATSEAAQHLGANDLGTIAPGKLADMILVDGDPVTNIAALRNIPTVIKNGEVISA